MGYGFPLLMASCSATLHALPGQVPTRKASSSGRGALGPCRSPEEATIRKELGLSQSIWLLSFLG